MHGNNDDVVIVVPATENIKSDPLLVAGLAEHHSVCIETEDVIDPNSPKTVTESSSKFFFHSTFLSFLSVSIFLFVFFFFFF